MIPDSTTRHAGLSATVTAALILILICGLTGCVFLPFGGGGSGDSADEQAGTSAQEETAPPPEPIPTAIVLDASGSMKADDAPGVRFTGAQRAVTKLIDSLSPEQQAAVLAYGTGTDSSFAQKTAGCRDVKTLAKFGRVDKGRVKRAITDLKPAGYTPIAYSLKQAAAQLPGSGPRQIVLLTDGVDTCSDDAEGLDPCRVAQELGADGDLHIHAVGFRADGPTSKQLTCLADETGGSSQNALNGPQLSARMAAALNRPLADTRLSPAGYHGLTPGMTAQAATAAGLEGDIPATGHAELAYHGATVVFEDGKLREITTSTARTIDGLAPGDDISQAESTYKNPHLPTQVVDGTARYTADAITGTGYRIAFTGADAHTPGANPSGKITSITLCDCATNDSYSVAPPPLRMFPGCEHLTGDTCRTVDAVQVRHPEKGPLTLTMMMVYNQSSKKYGDTAATGFLWVVDADGKVTDPMGSPAASVADCDPHAEGGCGEAVGPAFRWDAAEVDEHRDSFKFFTPETDRDGTVFFRAPGVKNPIMWKPSRYGTTYELDVPDIADFQFDRDTLELGDVDQSGHYVLNATANGTTRAYHYDGHGYVTE
ncbi:VWA domain-containing protein [Brevibacterium sp. 91QC2O2]|uniref:vWA domain-containing protein n=1 Tax=Brevibacterium sp. 91QC2O2 TaxID=2968458 RepID=UPI00211D09BC|nr:VWA domain-containing protein [Brevibacterium sp. 91QC2O2]